MSDIWTGTVDAKLEQGQPTGFTVNKGDIITIVASGWAERGPGKTFGPQGDQVYKPTGLTSPEANIGALLVKIGDQIFPVNSGLFRWEAPASGELVFLFNDTPGGYDNNSGAFNVSVGRDSASGQPGTGTGPATDTLKYGDKIHLLNGYANWNGGYLDSYGHATASGAKYGVVTSSSPTRGAGTGTWVVESASGKANGTEVLNNDTVRLKNLYSGDGGYLDTNGHARYPTEMYEVMTADTSRLKHRTSDWTVISAGSKSAIEIGSVIHLQNMYQNNGGFLDTCEHFRSPGGLYNVFTTQSNNRDGGTGLWKVLRA